MKTFVIWIKSVFRWLIEWRYFCFGIFPVLFGICYGADEDMIRVSGMVLQLLGIGTVAWDINARRKEFGHPSVLKVWHQRLKRFPLFGKQAVTGTCHVTLSAMTCSGRANQSVNAGPEATTEERIQALNENLQIVHDRVSQAQNEIDQGFHKYSEELTLEKQFRVQEDKKIHAKLEATETGGLHILGMGALWLFQGVIMSTIPAELAELLR